ncbi:MAG: hypothetical protein MUE30_15910 [Spirosomaceae bacterium]|jgi:hypothetical protein|nr:hypothetical protein [Spirosomataceae bacterium]
MKSNAVFYILLVVLGAVDAWLLAHPNLLGKLGILFYNYDMIKTIPRAFMTVGATIAVCLLLGWGIQKLQKPISTIVLGLLTVGAIGLIINTYMKFSAGTYAYTGTGFKTGAVLLPVIIALIFGESLGKVLKK